MIAVLIVGALALLGLLALAGILIKALGEVLVRTDLDG